MAYETLTPVDADSDSLPAPAHVARNRALRRFNWGFVYLPLILAAGIGLVLFGALLWTAMAGQRLGGLEAGAARQLVSGLADMFFVLAALPLALLCSVVPLLLFAGLIQARRRGVAPLRRLQQLLRRLDLLLQRVDQHVERHLPRLANAVIRARSSPRLFTVMLKRLAGHRAAPLED